MLHFIHAPTGLGLAGDFYVTRHASLANMHVVFHLVVDDEVRRHPPQRQTIRARVCV